MDKNYTNIKERILYFAKKQGVSLELFLSEIGMTYGSFKGKAKEMALNSDAIERILTKYPTLSPEWLLLGTGDIYKTDKDVFMYSNPDLRKAIVSERHQHQESYKDELIRILIGNVKALEKEVNELKELLKQSQTQSH